MVEDAANRLPAPWHESIVGSIDCKAVNINRPKYHQRRFYNGKYKHHVVNIQMVTNNQGVPVKLDGPYAGRTHDIRLYHHTQGSLNLGDKVLLGKALFFFF